MQQQCLMTMNHLDHTPIYGYFFKSMRDLFMIRRTIKNIRFMIRWMTKIYVLWYFEWRKYRFYDALNEENIRFMMHWMRKIYVLWCAEWGNYTFYDALSEENICFMLKYISWSLERTEGAWSFNKLNQLNLFTDPPLL